MKHFQTLNRWLFALLIIGVSSVTTLHADQDRDDRDHVRDHDKNNFNLRFTGSGSKAASKSTYVNRYDRDDHKFKGGMITSTGRESFSGSGYIEIRGNMGRIKLPSKMIPAIQSGDDGWFSISDLWIGDDKITGRIRINGLNKPKLTIDRRIGSINLKGGLSDFEGECELMSNDPRDRRF